MNCVWLLASDILGIMTMIRGDLTSRLMIAHKVLGISNIAASLMLSVLVSLDYGMRTNFGTYAAYIHCLLTAVPLIIFLF